MDDVGKRAKKIRSLRADGGYIVLSVKESRVLRGYIRTEKVWFRNLYREIYPKGKTEQRLHRYVRVLKTDFLEAAANIAIKGEIMKIVCEEYRFFKIMDDVLSGRDSRYLF